jgi:hypothetical protein
MGAYTNNSSLTVTADRGKRTKRRKRRTDLEEVKARDREYPDQTVIHSPVMHPVLNGKHPIYTQTEKADANYEFRSRHEQFMMHLNDKLYVPNSCREGYEQPLDCSFYEAPEDQGIVHHRKFGMNGDTLLRYYDKRSTLRKKKIKRSKNEIPIPML